MNETILRKMLVGSAAVAVVAGAGIGTSVALSGGSDSPRDIAERGTAATTPSSADDTPDPAATNLAPGATQTFPAGDAGFVTVTRDAGGLRVVTVAPGPGATFETEQAAGREIEVQFVRNGVRTEVNLELEDGAVRVRVRNRAADDDDGPDTSVPTTGGPSPTVPSPTIPSGRVDNSGPGSASSGPGPGPNVDDDNNSSGPGSGVDDDSSGHGSGGSDDSGDDDSSDDSGDDDSSGGGGSGPG